MKRVLLDQGLAPATAVLLRAEGWEASHVVEVNLDRAEDVEILAFGQKHGMVCVTLDHDFHAHLALSLAGSPSVILVRVEGMNAERQADLIRAVWAACGDALAQGAAVSTDGVAVRIHRLPLK